MEMPNILVAGGFIMLASRSTLALISVANSYGNFLCSLINLRNLVVRNIVDVFVMPIRNYQHMAGIINPPLRCDEGRRKFILVDNILLVVVVGFFSAQKGAKRTIVVFGFVVKHAVKYTRIFYLKKVTWRTKHQKVWTSRYPPMQIQTKNTLFYRGDFGFD